MSETTLSKMEPLKAYEVITPSSDLTFATGDIIWMSEDRNISIAGPGSGCINADELVNGTEDFRVKESKDYVVYRNGRAETLIEKKSVQIC